MDNELYFRYPDSLVTLIAQAAVWLAVLIACAVAVRRPWARVGLLGALIGAGVAVAQLVDHLQFVAADGGTDGEPFPVPGFVADRDLYAELMWAQTAGIAVLGVAIIVAAMSSRRDSTS